MIGVGAPWILAASVLVAVATCVLHFISVRRPPVLLLPTMRFLPERPVRAVSRSARPSDLWLLLLRVLAVLLAGAALSGLYWRAAGTKHGRIVVIQHAPNDDVVAVRNAVARAIKGAFTTDTSTRIVVLDTVAHMLTGSESQAFRAETLSQVNFTNGAQLSTLSAGVLAATRAANLLVTDERNVDVVDLVIVAPFTPSWRDAAAPIVRASWPGAIRLIAARDTARGASGVAADSADVLMAVPKRRVTLAGDEASDAVLSALLARGWMDATSGTTARFATAISTGNAAQTSPISIEWPASGVPAGWDASPAKTVGAVVARGEALVFPFHRTAHVPAAILARARPLAWWSDGEVAAIEVPTGASCTRHVGIQVPAASDLLQGPAARALLLALSGPCGGEQDRRTLSDDELELFAGKGASAPASAFKSAAVVRTPWAWVLLMLAIALLIAEWFLRDREDATDTAVITAARNAQRAA